ncbi:MAG: hypothetical protein BJ554DRAFT_1105 [Olpidium bornovanus]|uniref:Integral membrane protein n=1 Tax=Olpidium bornovanus TaxID=278681 RepID=A0A8H8DHD5_9FUNG|nr:MAG: hypothetical protein BJ554DRAFT_1105 [Olpidium bornovanus]
MSDFVTGKVVFVPPQGYVTPSWPSLYWPFQADAAMYLYYPEDILVSTLIWTMVIFIIMYGTAGIWAFFMLRKSHALSYLVPWVFTGIGMFSGAVGGSVIGYVLGLVYNAGFFRMSTWVPFLWALIQALTMVVSSYPTIARIL